MMEIVMATTTRDRAESMRRYLVGRTMSGEGLEKRPMVQYTGAADFLDAAMRIYDIIAIRVEPSSHAPTLFDVIARYERHIFLCEACGNVCGFPRQLMVVRFSEHHCWCSPNCMKVVEAELARSVEVARTELGDPVTAILKYVFTHNTLLLPLELHRLLTESELRQASNHLWQIGRQGLFTALVGQLASLGIHDLTMFPSYEPAPIEPPHWMKSEYWQGERRCGFVLLADIKWAEGTPWYHKDTYWCMVDCPDGTPLCLGTEYPLRAAKKRVEEHLRQADAVEAFRTDFRNYRALVFQFEWEV